MVKRLIRHGGSFGWSISSTPLTLVLMEVVKVLEVGVFRWPLAIFMKSEPQERVAGNEVINFNEEQWSYFEIVDNGSQGRCRWKVYRILC